MAYEGGCRCGAVRYSASGEPQHVNVCHCEDCRRSAGAPMVVWAMFAEDRLDVRGKVASYTSSPAVTRQFCSACGTGLFYRNPQIFPDGVDIQANTLDDAAILAPQAHIQMAEAMPWAHRFDALPRFERYPPG